MDRRRYLALVAAASSGTLTGCLGFLGDDGGDPTPSPDDTPTPEDTDTPTETPTPTPTETPTETPTPTPDTSEAAESIEAAKSHVVTASDLLAEESDSFEGVDGVSFEGETIRDELAAATGALDAAAGADPTDGQVETIDRLRRIVSVFESLTDGMESLAEGLDAADRAFETFDVERYDEADASLDEALEKIEVSRKHLGTASDELGNLDTAGMDDVDLERPRTALDDLDGLLSVVVPFLSGFQGFVRGQSTLQAGFTAMNTEEFDRAIQQFQEAGTHFSDASTAFATADDRDAEDTLGELEWFVCQTTAFSDAAGHLAEAARLQSEGEGEAAEEAFARAEEQLQQCQREMRGIDSPARSVSPPTLPSL